MEWGTYSMAPSLTELLFPVPLPEPAGGPPWWKTPPFSIICRTQRDIFGRSFHAVKILLEVSASRDWFLDLYVVVQSERRSETANRQEASELTTLKPSSEGAGIPRPLRFWIGPWDMRSRETAAPWSTRGGRVGRTVPWRHRRETDTVKWGVVRSTSWWGGGGGESSLAWALGHQVFFTAAALEIITVLRSVLHFDGFGWARFPCPHS